MVDIAQTKRVHFQHQSRSMPAQILDEFVKTTTRQHYQA